MIIACRNCQCRNRVPNIIETAKRIVLTKVKCGRCKWPYSTADIIRAVAEPLMPRPGSPSFVGVAEDIEAKIQAELDEDDDI